MSRHTSVEKANRSTIMMQETTRVRNVSSLRLQLTTRFMIACKRQTSYSMTAIATVKLFT